GSQKCGLIEQVFQVGPGKPGRTLGQGLNVHIGSKRFRGAMDLKDAFPAPDIGHRDHDLPVESARAKQGRVENVGPVGRGNQNHALVGLKAVHLDQELIESLFALIMPTAKTSAAMPSHSVDLVDKDDAGGIFFALKEQVAHTRCANANEHLDKIRAAYREKRDPCFTRDGPRKQSFARTGRAYEQDAFWDSTPEFGEFLRVP